MPTSSITIRPIRLTGFCLAIAAFELLTYMASDLIMPAMLGVTEQLEANPRHVPYAFTLYLTGGVLLQWLVGPLSDHYGRRPLLLMGSGLFALACGAAYWVQGIEAFNGLRLIQGTHRGQLSRLARGVLRGRCRADHGVAGKHRPAVSTFRPLIG